MAISIDQLNVGTAVHLGTSAATVAITTNVAIAANGLIVLAVAVDQPPTSISSASGASLTWTIDQQGVVATTSEVIALISAPCVAGLASGQTFTVTPNASSASRFLGGMSILGADLTASRVDGTPPALNSLTTAAWATASMTLAAGSIAVAVTVIDVTTTMLSMASGCTKAWEANESVGGNSAAQAYRIEAAGGSFTVGGTWNAATSGGSVGVAYKAAAVAAVPPPRPHLIYMRKNR